jgi:hypothetical protein
MIEERLATPATRRTVVKTGVKLAYAAPLVAASLGITRRTALAADNPLDDLCAFCYGDTYTGDDSPNNPGTPCCTCHGSEVPACTVNGEPGYFYSETFNTCLPRRGVTQPVPPGCTPLCRPICTT